MRKMRVIAGKAGSLPLSTPCGVDIRPTTDAMRESVFGSIGPQVEGARFADLYAGSGAVGIEALSRGARQVIFVESSRRCREGIEANLANTHLAADAVVMAGRVLECWTRVATQYGPFDIIFVDPPYGSSDLPLLTERLIVKREGVADQALIIIQHDSGDPVDFSYLPKQSKMFGQTKIDLFRVDPVTGKDNGSA